MKLRLLCLFLVCCLKSNGLIAQSARAKSCQLMLTKIEESIKNGQIDAAVANEVQIENCLNSNDLSKEDKIKAYKFLTIIYLYLNENIKARQNMQEFMRRKLKSNPDYKPTEEEPESKIPEFLEEYRKLRYWPIYYWGFRGGVNLSDISMIRTFSVDQSNVKDFEYKQEIDFQFSFAAEIPIFNGKFSLAPELQIARYRYTFTDTLLGFATLSFEETQTWVRLPILFKYHLVREGKKKWGKNRGKTRNDRTQIFFELGASVDYLLSANASATLEGRDTLNGEIRQPIKDEFNLIDEDLRQPLNFSIIGGAGLRFKNFLKSGGDLLVQGRYNYGINNLVKTKNRYASNPLLYTYGYVDSDVRLNRVSFVVSYMLPVFKPRLIKKSSKPYSIKF